MRNFINCQLCPCTFLTQTDLMHHMEAFTDDPVIHIRRFADGMSYPPARKRRRRLELYDEYLTRRGIPIRPRPGALETRKVKEASR